VTDTTPPADDAHAPRRVGVIRSSMIYAALTLVSRFMGLARDLVITAKLGASATIAADAYYTALTFPNLFRRIFAEGAFAAAFVPTYAGKLEGDGAAEADRFASDALATVAAAAIAVTIVVQLAMPWLMYLYSPGYVADPAKFRLAIVLTQITMPYLPCMVIAALFSGVLTARGRFVIYGLYPTLLNLCMLAAVLPQHDPVRAAWWASGAVVVAGISQAALCWWGARRAGARIRLVRPKLSPEMKALARLALPAAFANSAVQINIFVSAILASQVPGMRAWLNVAERFYQLPLSLVGTAIGVALLPRLAQAFRRGDHDDAQAATDQGMVFALALSLPAAAALVAIPGYLVDGLFARGAFTHHDARASALILLNYGWGLPAFVLVKILQPAFFARQDTATPMRYSLISVAINIVLGVVLFYTVGFQGTAMATSAATWITVAQMALRLRRDGAYTPSARAWSKMARVAAASLGMGALLALASHFRAEIEAPLGAARLLGLGAKEVCVLAVCAVGGAIYPLLLFAFGGVTLTEVKTAFRRGKGEAAPIAADLP
jgi:putative peptidoglycan lipid II flippase